MNAFNKLGPPAAVILISLACGSNSISGKYLHMSCAGIHHPNLGANNVPFMIGVTWFFD